MRNDASRKKLFWAWSFSAFLMLGCFAQSSFAQDPAPSEVDPADSQQESVASLQQKAGQLRQQEKWEEAVVVYRELVKRDPKSGIDWHLLGFCLHGTGEIDKAITAHKIAAEFDQFKAISQYNLGCAYSLKNDTEKSLEFLRQAIDSGFAQIDLLESDSDLANTRKDERFIELLAYANGESPDKAMEAQEESKPKAEDKPKVEKNPLVGDWKMLNGVSRGEKVPSDRMPPEISVTAEVFTLPSPEGGDPFVMSYVVDDSKKPASIDFNIESGPIPQGEALGIFKLVDDKLTLIYDPTAQNRPESFESTEENGYLMFEMKKQPRNVALARKLIGKWVFKSGTHAGSEVAKDRLQIIVDVTDKTFTIPVGTDEKFVISYELDAMATPMKIDMKIESGPAPEGSKAVGIIQIGDGEFTICYDSSGGKRPGKFESTEENGCFMFKLKKMEVD